MITLTATCRNGSIYLDRQLSEDLEGKKVKITIEDLSKPKKRRQSGTAKAQIWIADDFGTPLIDFEDESV